jgi:hypothetical protein
VFHDLILSFKEAVREWKHRRALRKQQRRMADKYPIPF